MENSQRNSVGAWAKKYYQASRSAMESILRPHELGSTQWFVLWQLVNNGPTTQGRLLDPLQVEKATLSEVVAALVRKGWVEQTADSQDRRQKVLSLTPAGQGRWDQLPDPIDIILKTAFADVSPQDLDTAVRVLSAGTAKLNSLDFKGNKS